MENFNVFNPTNLHFGKNVTDNLGEIIKIYGKKVLLIYGKGSIKRNGIYDNVISQLQKVKCKVIEYAGIKSNPVIDDVEKAIKVGVENNIDVVLAVGGGSVIDTAKIVAICIPENIQPWDFMKNKVSTQKSKPLIVVLTVAATGSEMNSAFVIQNHKTQEKIGNVNMLAFPKHSFLDPQFTYSIPANYTAYGIVDLISHALEAFFGYGNATLSDNFVYSIIKDAIYYAPLVLKEPNNYDYRANIMLDATCALNGITNYGRKVGDWGVHDIGHVLSLLYDIPHGATLSIAYPAWMKLQSNRIPNKIKELGINIFNTKSVNKTIKKFETFFKSINSPIRLSELNIDEGEKDEIVSIMNKNKVNGYNNKLTTDDYKKLVDFML